MVEADPRIARPVGGGRRGTARRAPWAWEITLGTRSRTPRVGANLVSSDMTEVTGCASSIPVRKSTDGREDRNGIGPHAGGRIRQNKTPQIRRVAQVQGLSVEMSGLEPPTYALRTRRSPN